MRIGATLLFFSLFILLTTAAFLPLLDINLLLHNMSVTSEPVETHYLAIRSATFASLAFFTVNFLRYKRPLSAVAPMLSFCNFLVFFGAALMVKRAQFEVIPWVVLCLIVALSVFLYRENKAQTSVIFKDSW
jgi:hypothetical protein